jgi:hypothetical protein
VERHDARDSDVTLVRQDTPDDSLSLSALSLSLFLPLLSLSLLSLCSLSLLSLCSLSALSLLSLSALSLSALSLCSLSLSLSLPRQDTLVTEVMKPRVEVRHAPARRHAPTHAHAHGHASRTHPARIPKSSSAACTDAQAPLSLYSSAASWSRLL